jgi:hypothetical protein
MQQNDCVSVACVGKCLHRQKACTDKRQKPEKNKDALKSHVDTLPTATVPILTNLTAQVLGNVKKQAA